MEGDISRSIDDFKAEQAVFTILAAFYNNNPDVDMLKAVAGLDADGVMDDGELKAAVSLIKNSREDLLELKRDWTKLFRGVSPDYGAKPPYEQLFSGGEVAETVVGLAKIYTDYGLKPQEERHDYIGVEFAFLAIAAANAVEAYERGDSGAFADSAKAFKDFLENHPKRWFPNFKKAALPIASTDFYRGVLELTELLLR
jgi:TorA maturation chaperone TorD